MGSCTPFIDPDQWHVPDYIQTISLAVLKMDPSPISGGDRKHGICVHTGVTSLSPTAWIACLTIGAWYCPQNVIGKCGVGLSFNIVDPHASQGKGKFSCREIAINHPRISLGCSVYVDSCALTHSVIVSL